jgi:hypothetical protein
MDVSGGVLANLGAGHPCRHDEDLHFHDSVGDRQIVNHFVAIFTFLFKLAALSR